MAVGDFLTWAVQAQDAPAHVARILQTILLNEGVVDVAGGSFQVTEDTGANMNIQIGSGTLGDLAVVEGDDVAGQGVYVHEAQNGTVTRAVAASDPSQDRIDLVVLQNYDDEADSSTLNDAEVEVIQGTPAASPSAPALPDSAISLATILVGAGVTAVTNANIMDTRVEAKTGKAAPGGLLAIAGVFASQSTITTEVDLTGLTVTIDVPANRRIRLSAETAWNATNADNVVICRIKESTTTLQTGRTVVPVGGSTREVTVASSRVITPSAGSHTYKLTAEMPTGTGSIELKASASQVAFIQAEDLGPA